MLNYVNRILIGKASGAANTGNSVTNLAKGDIILIDGKTGVLIDTNAKAAAAKSIRIAAGSRNGSPILSSVIERSTVSKFTEQAYAAPVANVETISDAKLVAGKEFKLVIVFHDDQRLLPNKQQRVVISHTTPATGFVAATELAAIVNKVAKDRNAGVLVTGAVAGSGLTFTGKPIPTKSIEDYQYVNFTASFVNVTDDTFVASVRTAKPTPGNGLPVQVRAMERMALGYLGFTDLRDFRTNKDVPFMTSDEVAGNGYDLIHVLHADVHTGDLQSEMKSPLQTTIAVATGSTQANAIKPLIQSFVAGIAEDLGATPAVDAPAGE